MNIGLIGQNFGHSSFSVKRSKWVSGPREDFFRLSENVSLDNLTIHKLVADELRIIFAFAVQNLAQNNIREVRIGRVCRLWKKEWEVNYFQIIKPHVVGLKYLTLGQIEEKKEEIREIVRIDGLNLRYLSKALPEFYIDALTQNGLALQYIPHQHQTREMWEVAIRNNWQALRFIPAEEIDRELCLFALAENDLAFHFTPRHFDDLCMSWILSKNNFPPDLVKLYEDGLKLEHVPFEEKTPLNCLFAVCENPAAISEVPKHLLTIELLQVAFNIEFESIFEIRLGTLTPEICLEIIKADKKSYRYLSKFTTLNSEIFLKALKEEKITLKQIPYKIWTEEICLIAVERNGLVIAEILKIVQTPYQSKWKGLLTSKVCFASLQNNGLALKHFVECPKFLTTEMCQKAVEENPLAIRYLLQIHHERKDLLSSEICSHAVRRQR